MPDIEIPTEHGGLRGYLSVPEGDGPWPGVIAVHDVFGMTADLRSQCDWLASAGYLTVGPNLYFVGREVRLHALDHARPHAAQGPIFR
jgi:carboxymethylenebutenolidase